MTRMLPRVSLDSPNRPERVEDPTDPISCGFHLVSPRGCPEVWTGTSDGRWIVQGQERWGLLSRKDDMLDFPSREACVREVLLSRHRGHAEFDPGTRAFLQQVWRLREEAKSWLPLRFVGGDVHFVPDDPHDGVFLREQGWPKPGEFDLYTALVRHAREGAVEQVNVLLYAAVWTAFGPDTSDDDRRWLWSRLTRPFYHHNRTKHLMPFDMDSLLPEERDRAPVVLATAIGAAVRLAYAHLLRGQIFGPGPLSEER